MCMGGLGQDDVGAKWAFYLVYSFFVLVFVHFQRFHNGKSVFGNSRDGGLYRRPTRTYTVNQKVHGET